MIIKWGKIALSLGGVAFIVVFLFNLGVNLLWTSFYRGIIAFCFFFLLGLIISIFLYYSMDINKTKGINIDLKTINQDNIDYAEIYNISNENNFNPLKFNKIESSEEIK